MGINGNMIKHYKTKAYTIEQYDENIASILMRKPYDKEFDVNQFKRQILALLMPILRDSEELSTDCIVLVDSTANVINKDYTHNDTRVEIYLKFLKQLPFKEKVKYIENNLINFILNITKKDSHI